jgi:hypothetical protein
MADKVNIILESMIPELEVLVQHGVFIKKDVKKILKKRRFYEYQFERKDLTKTEFFKAIRYEKVLDQRRIKKKKELNIKKINYYDFHCNKFLILVVRRIVSLFKKCLNRFKKDELIWMEFFNYLLKHKCHGILNREIGNCLINHPHKLDFWRIAAYNEFENNFNTIAARNIFQKSLRLNKHNLEANLDYFVFELKFVEKIMQRRNLLLNNEKKNKKVFIDDLNEEENKKAEVVKIDKAEENISDDILSLKVPEIIWHKAHENLKGFYKTVEIDLAFLSKLFKYGKNLNYKRLKNVLLDNIKQNNPDSVDLECNIVRAKLEKYDTKEYLKKAISKFTKLVPKYEKSNNLVLANLINTFLQKAGNENLDEAQDYLFKNIHMHIDTEDLAMNYLAQYNITLAKFTFEQCIFNNQVNTSLNMEPLINSIITNIVESNYAEANVNAVNEYFNLYWKFLVYNRNQDIQQIYEQIVGLLTNKNKASGFYFMMIKNLCTMIEDDIKIYSERFDDYVSKIDNIIRMKKITDLTMLKDIWKTMLEIIVRQYLLAFPKDITYMKICLENDFVEKIKNLKKKFSNYLINYSSMLKEIQVIFNLTNSPSLKTSRG